MYDSGLGDRHQQNGVTYTLDLNAGLTQVLADGTNTYLYGNGRISQHELTTEYYLTDALGSVRQLADATGGVTLTQSYAPYGDTTSSVGTGSSLFQFTGEARDTNGLTYLRARYLDSSTGRFTQRDPSGLETNLYLYAQANPVNRVDPTGYFSNAAITRSFGVDSFDDVIQLFRHYSTTTTLFNEYPRWGFLHLLQEASIGDTLTGISIEAFGKESKIPLGKFECVNGEIKIGKRHLQSAMMSFNDIDSNGSPRHGLGGTGTGIAWRSKLHGYYLDERAFRDGHNSTDLPDFATFSFGLDAWYPAGLAGVGLGGMATYIVDRYGQPYLSIAGSISGGAVPFTLAYSEGYINKWSGAGYVASQSELAHLIPGWAIALEGAFAIYSSGEVNLDSSFDDYWKGTVGIGFPQVSIGIGVSRTWPLPSNSSINPKGWAWIEDIPGYTETDVLSQSGFSFDECGCY